MTAIYVDEANGLFSIWTATLFDTDGNISRVQTTILPDACNEGHARARFQNFHPFQTSYGSGVFDTRHPLEKVATGLPLPRAKRKAASLELNRSARLRGDQTSADLGQRPAPFSRERLNDD